jgi:magnesium transporter
MVTIYKSAEQGLSMLTEPIDGCWINAVNPTSDEVHWLQGLGIPQDYITYPLDVDERARTERENGELLIVLRVPYFNGHSADIPYTTLPLGIILTGRYLVTVCKRENDIINEFASGKMKNLATGKRLRFVLRLLLNAATRYLAHLREINHHVESLEDQLQLSTRNKEVLELLKYQKSLTYFTTALKSNELMMERLQRSQIFKAYPEDEDLLEDVITENQQAIEMTNIASNILSGMMDAFASIISNNLNTVMKFLASITIVVSLPTIIFSYYGMNVNLPFGEHPLAFVLTLAAAILISAGVVIIFVRRDWL